MQRSSKAFRYRSVCPAWWLIALLAGCSDTLIDPRKPPTDAGLPDISTDSPWDFDSFNTCATNERLCTVEGPPCEPLDDAGLPPVGCGPQTQCIDVMSNNQRCGNCDAGCNTDTHQCESGQCVCKIEGADSCGSHTCIDLDTSRQHCGACFLECDPGENCAGGECFEAPGDLPWAGAEDSSGPIEMNFGASPQMRQITINNYGKDDPLTPATGDACSDAVGPDVFLRAYIPMPSNPPAEYGVSFSANVNKPGYSVAIWAHEGTATGAPDRCNANELGYASASLTVCGTIYQFSVMVRKLYATPENGGPVTVTISASGGAICITPPPG